MADDLPARFRDTTPIDEAWLREIGAFSQYGFTRLDIGRNGIAYSKRTQWAYLNERSLPDITTRGQLLLLLAALGWEGTKGIT